MIERWVCGKRSVFFYTISRVTIERNIYHRKAYRLEKPAVGLAPTATSSSLP
jgi:hypothetical protein